MLRSTIFLAAAIPMAAPVLGETLTMVCENPRREYVVTYDADLDRLVFDDTPYLPLAFQDSDDKVAVAGMVGQGSGLGFLVEFSPYKRVVLYSDDQAFQTDACR